VQNAVRATHELLTAFAKSPNIAAEMLKMDGGQDRLDTIGERVCREYEIDKKSRSDWEARTKDAMDLALQVVQKKTFPWPGAANIKYPLLTVAAIQFNARAYPAIVAGRDVVKGVVIGSDDGVPAGQDQAGNVTWQVPPGAKRDRADRIAEHMSWQLTEEMDEWEDETDRLLIHLPIVGCAFRKVYFDSGLGRNCATLVSADDCVVNYNAKSIITAPRVTHRLHFYPYEIAERMRSGVWLDTDIGKAPDAGDDDEAPVEFLEQHRRWDLDDDGYPEPYIVTVHKETGSVVRIVARYDETKITMNARGQVSRIEPIQYWVKYGFIPSPDGGFYDVGFGTLLNPINEAVNSTLNRLLDAGTMQVTGGGFMGSGLKMKGGPMRFQPGEWKRIESQGGTIRDNLVPLPTVQPSEVLFKLLGLLIDAGKEIASVKDILTGDTQGASTQPATTTLALIEQGMKTFTAIFKRIHRSLKDELKKLFDLNAEHLQQQQYFTVMDTPKAIARADYKQGDADIVPVSDPTSVSDMQKLVRAEFLKQFTNDPLVNQQELRERIFRAANVEDIDKLMQPQPTPDQVKASIWTRPRHRREQESKAVANFAGAVKDLTDAEAVATNTTVNLAGVSSMLTELLALAKGQTNDPGIGGSGPPGVPAVEGSPGNPGGPGVPAPVPSGADGGMGGGQPPPGQGAGMAGPMSGAPSGA
jgi:chaperonin GroES